MMKIKCPHCNGRGYQELDDKKDLPKLIAIRLRKLREERNLSQEEMGEAAGISREGYRNIETGRSVPRINTLMRIALALGLTVEDLIPPQV
jgi:transcriptional regulator with XRE-family HTH domain